MQRYGNYDVIAPIARSEHGGVYLAADRTSGATVVLKVLDASSSGADRLFTERRISQRVHHPNLVEIHSAARAADGTPFLVLEYLHGEDLGEMVQSDRLATGAILAIACQVASGLAALHDANIVHCDVKPDNVFVLHAERDWPHVKVIDYGAAQFVEGASGSSTTISGTPACMAPEQWLGAPTPKSDVYALGCMLFELLTGAPVFTGSLAELRVAHTEEPPRRLHGEHPPALEDLVVRSLAKDPGLRPTMRELARSLAALAVASLDERGLLATG